MIWFFGGPFWFGAAVVGAAAVVEAAAVLMCNIENGKSKFDKAAAECRSRALHLLSFLRCSLSIKPQHNTPHTPQTTEAGMASSGSGEVPSTIYHLAAKEEWEAAVAAKRDYFTDSLEKVCKGVWGFVWGWDGLIWGD